MLTSTFRQISLSCAWISFTRLMFLLLTKFSRHHSCNSRDQPGHKSGSTAGPPGCSSSSPCCRWLFWMPCKCWAASCGLLRWSWTSCARRAPPPAVLVGCTTPCPLRAETQCSESPRNRNSWGTAGSSAKRGSKVTTNLCGACAAAGTHTCQECLIGVCCIRKRCFTLAYLGSRGKLAIFFPKAVRWTWPSFLSTAPSSSKCSTAERTASRQTPKSWNGDVPASSEGLAEPKRIVTRRRLRHEIKIHHIWDPQRHQLQHHTSQVTPAAWRGQAWTPRHASGAHIYARVEFSSQAPLNFRHSHRDEAVKFLLRVEAIAQARVLPAGSASSLPRLGFRNPLDCQNLQSIAWKT